MDKIIVRDLLARGPVGITEEERSRPQDILINITAETDMRAAEKSDNIADCVNYSTVAKDVFATVENNQRKTLEALAGDIATKCLENPLVTRVIVRVEKTSIVRFAKAAGVEIDRSR